MNSTFLQDGPQLSCEPCAMDFPKPALPLHLEEFHVGPRLLDAMYICCGTCHYRVSGEKSVLMMEHCVRSEHSSSKTWTDWTNFLSVENERIVRLITAGADFLRGKQTFSNDERISLSATPQVSSGNEITRFRPGGSFNSQRDSFNGSYSPQWNPASMNTSSGNLPQIPSPLLSKRFLTGNHRMKTPRLKVPKASPSPNVLNQTDHAYEDELDQYSSFSGRRPIKEEAEPKRRPWSPSELEDPDEEQADGNPGEREIAPSPILADSSSLAQDSIVASPSNQDGRTWGTQCRICQKKICTKLKGDTLPTAFKHVFSHDKSVLPFKCVSCNYRTNRKKYIERHSKTRNGGPNCTGESVDLVDDRMRKRLRSLLHYSFPDIKWDVKIPPGKFYNEIQF